MKDKFKRIKIKAKEKVESKILALHIFDEPRPNYISKISWSDKILAGTILKLFPVCIRPNFLTVFRFITIPFIIIVLLGGDYLVGLILFSISAFTDALDGAMARTRNMITDWGIVFDPLADKLLIGSVAIIIISKLINPFLAGTVVTLEILLVVFSYFRFKGEIVPAKMAGKIKMILQSFGVGLLLLFLVVNQSFILSIATYIIFASIFFALLSLFVYRSI
jgi:CDP-diacylglycerol--glycerol-3-phosphate 3-phosphatidyltransferase